MKKRWIVLLVLVSCFGGCLSEKEEKEVKVNIENEDVIAKESREVAEGYGLEMTKALELVKGLKREGLTVQDLNKTAEIAAQESVNVGMEFSDGTRKNIDTLIKDYKTENSEEIKANNLKDSDIKEIVTDSVKSGFIQSVIAEDGVEDTVLFVNNSKLDNEVKDRVGYNSLLEKFNKKR